MLRSLWGNMYSLNHFTVFLCFNILLQNDIKGDSDHIFSPADPLLPFHTASHHLFLVAFLLSALWPLDLDHVAVLRSLWGNMYSLNHFT
ncbi:hypothetical protein ACJX0J_015749, partial [Zea mays]